MDAQDPRQVRIAQFKARLSEHLRAVRRGRELTLLVRDTPVARVVPWEGDAGGLVVRTASRPLKGLKLPRPLKSAVDSLAALLAERQGER